MIEPIYTDDWVTLYHGDCLEVLPELGTVDHVITDPPYSEHVHSKQWIGAALSEGCKRTSTAHASLGFAALDASTRQAVLGWMAVRARRWGLFFCDIESLGGWRDAGTTDALDYVRGCVWDKIDGAPQFTGDRPASGAEALACLHRKGKKRWNGGGRRGVFRHRVNGERGAKPHPTTKPLSLMRELVTLFTDEGETILDPFAGSGTTGRACKDLGRRCILIEREAKYCEVIIKRLAQERLL